MQILGVILTLLYLTLFISNLIWGVFRDNYTYMFSIVIIIVGINTIHKGSLLKSHSTLFFALNLILGAILIVVIEILKLEIKNFIYVFTIIPILSSVLILAILRCKIYVKVIILCMSLSIPVFVYQFTNLEWCFLIIIGVLTTITGIVICRNINFDKEKIDGKV